MTAIDRSKALDRVLAIAREAGEGIAKVYAGSFEVEFKGEDDPVTRADREANTLICAELARAFPGVPIVAEESEAASYAGFSRAPAAWFVDPLDGTRDFVARNGEFAVMIGLAEAGRSVLGVLVLPAFERSFVGAEGIGAFEVAAGGARTPIRVAQRKALAGARVLVSRSRRVPEAEAKIAALGLVAVPCGSAGVKGAKIACGEADLYAQPGNAGQLWDSCAPEAIVRAAGGQWRTGSGEPFDYARERLVNDRGIVAGNDSLVTELVASVEW
jgi:3'(2'), 5'-bisphosphate nucleotidase